MSIELLDVIMEQQEIVNYWEDNNENFIPNYNKTTFCPDFIVHCYSGHIYLLKITDSLKQTSLNLYDSLNVTPAYIWFENKQWWMGDENNVGPITHLLNK